MALLVEGLMESGVFLLLFELNLSKLVTVLTRNFLMDEVYFRFISLYKHLFVDCTSHASNTC